MAPRSCARVDARRDLPTPSYVLHSSPNHIHVFWRVTGFDNDLVERLQKQLARELQTDPAATPVTQNTRLPGFFNHKRAEPHLVTIEYRNVERAYGPANFPPVKEATAWPRIRASARTFELRSARHRPGKAVPDLGAAGDCRPARRRPHVSRLLPARTRIRAGRRPGAARAVGVERAVRAAMVPGGAARQASSCRSVRPRASWRAVVMRQGRIHSVV